MPSSPQPKLTKPPVGVVNWFSMGSGGGFHYVCSPFRLLRARTSPLVTLVTSDEPKDARYPGALWSRPMRSILPRMDRNTSRGTATSASWNTSRCGWRASRAPTLITLTWRLRSDQLLTALGRHSRCRKFPKAVSQMKSWGNIWPGRER